MVLNKMQIAENTSLVMILFLDLKFLDECLCLRKIQNMPYLLTSDTEGSRLLR